MKMKQTYFGYEYKGIKIYKVSRNGYTYWRIDGSKELYSTLIEVKSIIDA